MFLMKEGHLSVVSALAKTRYGMTRKGLSEATGLAYNGALSEILESLEQCEGGWSRRRHKVCVRVL